MNVSRFGGKDGTNGTDGAGGEALVVSLVSSCSSGIHYVVTVSTTGDTLGLGFRVVWGPKVVTHFVGKRYKGDGGKDGLDLKKK